MGGIHTHTLYYEHRSDEAGANHCGAYMLDYMNQLYGVWYGLASSAKLNRLHSNFGGA